MLYLLKILVIFDQHENKYINAQYIYLYTHTCTDMHTNMCTQLIYILKNEKSMQ